MSIMMVGASVGRGVVVTRVLLLVRSIRGVSVGAASACVGADMVPEWADMVSTELYGVWSGTAN